ncbi:hypothetical protein A2U01_0069174, partial [Trifolium medium]|nr:hypothetical protein [Trifolium medium]
MVSFSLSIIFWPAFKVSPAKHGEEEYINNQEIYRSNETVFLVSHKVLNSGRGHGHGRG